MPEVVKLKRGELRTLSAALIEKYQSCTFDEIAQLHVEAFGFKLPTARIHIRWMIREGLVNNGAVISERWPRRGRKIKSDFEPEVSSVKTAPEIIHTTETVTDIVGGMNKSMRNLLMFKRKA